MRLAARSGQHGGVCPRPSVTQPGTRMHAESAPPSTKNEKETMVPGTSRVSAAPAPCDDAGRRAWAQAWDTHGRLAPGPVLCHRWRMERSRSAPGVT